MTIQDIYTIVGSVIGVAGLIYAVMTNRAKARTERLIKEELRGLSGNIDKIRDSASWAGGHLLLIHKSALNLDRNDDVNEVLTHAQVGGRDAKAAERLLDNLLNQVLTLRVGMFGTKIIEHPGTRKQAGLGVGPG